VAKDKRHKTTLNREITAASLDAILEESRALRRQMADELSNEARKSRRMSRHFGRSRRSPASDEQSA
jgi:hypothetical protein